MDSKIKKVIFDENEIVCCGLCNSNLTKNIIWKHNTYYHCLCKFSKCDEDSGRLYINVHQKILVSNLEQKVYFKDNLTSANLIIYSNLMFKTYQEYFEKIRKIYVNLI